MGIWSTPNTTIAGCQRAAGNRVHQGTEWELNPTYSEDKNFSIEPSREA